MKKKENKQLRKAKERSDKTVSYLNSSQKVTSGVPKPLMLPNNLPGFFFGIPRKSAEDFYAGMRQGSDGHVLVVGGSGSGKSSGIAMPTLHTWHGPMCVTDINGELSDRYQELYEQAKVIRPYIRFDPTDLEGPSYDPLQFLLQDGEENLVSNIHELALALIPIQPDDKQPFWVETERAVLEAAILYYFPLGLSFSEIIAQVMSLTMTELCTRLGESKDIRIKNLLGEMSEMKAETIACVDRGLRNKLMLFATDPLISHALRGEREGAKYFSWDDLDDSNVFLCIPENRIRQWGPIIMLMLTQLIRHLERRPNKHSIQGKGSDQMLLLFDEFPRFGKLEMIADAISTLRSKKVNICLLIQSLAQLDKIYGEHDRRIIFENSQYKVILQCGDAETQEYISRLIGKYSRFSYGCAQHLDPDLECAGYNVQLNEIQEWMVQPHKLAALNDLLVLSPQGLFRVEKFLPGRESQTSSRFTDADPADWKTHLAIEPLKEARLNEKRNSGAKLLTIKERTKIAETLVEDALQKLQLAEKQAEEEAQAQRLADRQAREKKEKRAKYRKYIIGEVIAQYLPEIIGFEPEKPIDSSGCPKSPGDIRSEEDMNARLANRNAREAKKKRVESIAFDLGNVVTQHFSAIVGFEPGEKIESGDGIKILDKMLAELIANPDLLKELREKATAKSDDYTVILEEILANFVEHKDLLLQLRKKATEIVIIDNFFAELKAKNSSESMAIK